MMTASVKWVVRSGPLPGLFAAGLVAVVSACTSGPTPDQMARTTLETAPADLQLLCANEAARSAGVESSKVLPVSSRKLDAKNYQVELNAGGTPTRCIIDADGKIVSIGAA
ncbi:hypothetical protein RB623_21345 [Mesorhizobium sp. LHD-90]|uniref:hypothetical protein n=1 Tax=Mesorhizobium sp. LHD-90 TaxID=3071414 RepID=UPI0027DF0CA1|nr:hypothetical protein [Mesorhizobium sp. LHD-90]MDQ6436604.1 hypothetical protein [Mesorhizobium sp. LHD-90]